MWGILPQRSEKKDTKKSAPHESSTTTFEGGYLNNTLNYKFILSVTTYYKMGLVE